MSDILEVIIWGKCKKKQIIDKEIVENLNVGVNFRYLVWGLTYTKAWYLSYWDVFFFEVIFITALIDHVH